MMAEQTRFYDVLLDSNILNGWFPGDPQTIHGAEIDARVFTYGTPYRGPVPHHVPLREVGIPTAFTLASFDMPIVNSDVARVLRRLCAPSIELFPVVVGSLMGCEILNVIKTVRCIDDKRSEIMWWRPEDGRPDKVGSYRMITNLRVDPLLVGDCNIFRLDGWEVALIVSDTVKCELECIKDLGVVFEQVG